MITDEQKIKFFDELAKMFESHIEEQADKDLEPLEFDDEDKNGNIVRRYFPTSFEYRKECAVEELCRESEDLAPFAYDMFEYLGQCVFDFAARKENVFKGAE